MRWRAGGSPTLLWLGGFKSDMRGTKAEALESWASQHGRAMVRFDYSGHGESGGNFAEGTIGRWLEESLAVCDAFCRGPQVVVGSSMGAWLALFAALSFDGGAGRRRPHGGIVSNRIVHWLESSRVSGVCLILLLLCFWQFSALYMLDTPTWPPVTRILSAWYENIADGTLIRHLLATLWRQMLGYSLAVLLGVTLGVLMGYYRILNNLFEPLVEIFRPIPGPAYLPVLILFVGIGHEMKVVLIMIASLFPILLNTYGGVRAIDPVQLDTARTLGLTTPQAMREVVLPAASPQIFTGMRISLAISLILAILSEMIVSTDGLGYFTLLAERTFKVPEMYAGIFTLAIFGYTLNRLFLLGKSKLIRWHQESTGRR